MYLLDTNVVSLFEQRRREEAAPFISWVRRHDPLMFLSVVTLMEIEAGILKLRREDKTKRADQLVLFRDGVLADFGDRVLEIDARVAIETARIAEKARPKVVERLDLMIAATASINGFTVVTRNLRHFAPTGVPTLDPLGGLPAISQP